MGVVGVGGVGESVWKDGVGIGWMGRTLRYDMNGTER